MRMRQPIWNILQVAPGIPGDEVSGLSEEVSRHGISLLEVCDVNPDGTTRDLGTVSLAGSGPVAVVYVEAGFSQRSNSTVYRLSGLQLPNGT